MLPLTWLCASRTRGVRAPLCFVWELLAGNRGEECDELVGELDGGVDRGLAVLVPLVAATEGEDGGSGERVKYTTLAREPPISTAICDTGSI